ncbi:MAG: hypothetical protein QM478_11535 [Flavobacteriaceae bacterium]
MTEEQAEYNLSNRGGMRKGAGRKPDPNKKIMISKRITADVKDKLSKLAIDANIDETEALQRCILNTNKV